MFNLAARTLSGPDGELIPDRRVAEMLERCGYVDVAGHLYEQTDDPALLRRTGSDDRIDQIRVSGPLAPALRSYRLLDTPPGASDHHGIPATSTPTSSTPPTCGTTPDLLGYSNRRK